ncbi:hypothetical protein E2I00_012983, partial [Balaenoptera physalus]
RVCSCDLQNVLTDGDPGPTRASRQASALGLSEAVPAGNWIMPTGGRGAKAGLPSKFLEMRGRFLTKGFPDLSRGERRERGLGPRSLRLSHPTHCRAAPAIHQPAGPVPQRGPRSHPPAPSRGGCGDRGGNGGGEAPAQVLSTPPPHWPPSSGPCSPEPQGMGPSLRKGEKGQVEGLQVRADPVPAKCGPRVGPAETLFPDAPCAGPGDLRRCKRCNFLPVSEPSLSRSTSPTGNPHCLSASPKAIRERSRTNRPPGPGRKRAAPERISEALLRG